MNEDQRRAERRANRLNRRLAVGLALAELWGLLCHFADAPPLALWAARLVMAAVPVLYHFAVMRPRGSDILLDAPQRRIMQSLLMQYLTVLLFVLPFGYRVFFVPLETGHWGTGAGILLLGALLLPAGVHLGGCLTGLVCRMLRR